MKAFPALTLAIASIFSIPFSANSQSFCEFELAELKKLHLLAKYEQIPSEQKSNFLATLSNEQRMYILGSDAGGAIGRVISPSYTETRLEKFNRELEKFKKKCGFMLQ